MFAKDERGIRLCIIQNSYWISRSTTRLKYTANMPHRHRQRHVVSFKANKLSVKTQYNGHYAARKVTDLTTNPKRVYNFLFVNNINYMYLYPSSHRFQVFVEHWSNFCFRQGGGTSV